MAGVSWTSASLLTRFNSFAGRPTTDSITDAAKYTRLADAECAVLTAIAAVTPRQLYGAPTAMTSADGGYVWTFGTDGDGYALFPLGSAAIFPSLAAVPDYPWQPDVDYLDEGTQIRMPNNTPWAGPLYWRGITQPAPISATQQPFIQPPPSRVLIVIKAVWSFAEEYVRSVDLATTMENRWNREWPKNVTMIRRHFRGGRSLGPLTGYQRLGGGLGYGGYGYGAG